MKILITGPQGSGKTTQAKLLSEYLNIPLIDTGDMLRDIAKQENAPARIVKEKIENGEMAPNQVVGGLVEKRVGNQDCNEGFVMDGYPRSVSQLQIFDPGFDKVFYLKVDDRQVKKRLINRGREDDTPQSIEKRLRLYHQLTEPLLENYKQQGILMVVDGSLSIKQIQQQIRENL